MPVKPIHPLPSAPYPFLWSLVIRLLVALSAVLLPGCGTPASRTAPGTQVPFEVTASPTVIRVTEIPATVTPRPVTATPEPTPTMAPIQINHVETYPAVLRQRIKANTQRLIQDIQNKTSYATTPEYQQQLDSDYKSARRLWLAQQGVDERSMSDQEVFNTYVRYGNEHPQELLLFSPVELRQMNYDAMNRRITHYAHSDNTSGSYIFYDGIFYGFVPGNGIIDAKSLSQMMAIGWNDANIVNGLSVLGVTQNGLIPGYYGFVGDGAARFALPGIDPSVAQGILGHIYSNGQDIWLPAIINFQDVPIKRGDMIVNGNQKFVPIDHDVFIRYSHVTWPHDPGGIMTPPLTEQDVINLIGNKIVFRKDLTLGSGMTADASFPFNLGLQAATAEVRVLNPELDVAIFSGLPNWPWNRP